MTRFTLSLALAACGAFLTLFLPLSHAHAQSFPCYMEQGGNKLTIGSGCTLDIDTGAAIEMGANTINLSTFQQQGRDSYQICGEATTINNNTVYYGPNRTLVANTNGLSCDINAVGSTTESSADATVLAKNHYVIGMTCRNEGDANADITYTLRDGESNLSPSVTCTIADNARDCVADIQSAVVYSGHQVAIAATSTGNIADNNGFICNVFVSY